MATICYDDESIVFLSSSALRSFLEFVMERVADEQFKQDLFDYANWGNLELVDLDREQLILMHRSCKEYIAWLETIENATEGYIVLFRDALLLMDRMLNTS